ncbi:hypothetical protein CJU90_0706 [Yarrowia sp. C11]|nr:hypothetical protein CKK34_2118 [Yarrowia sp. E02]KAG5373039.1 hypothetical protein CJU90_0706 [Yarrowia sp. C11]
MSVLSSTSTISNSSPSTAPTSEFFDDHTNTVTFRVQCGGGNHGDKVQAQIEALNSRLDKLISGLSSLKGDNMVAVSALSSNMMYLEKQTELMVSYREQQEADKVDFEARLAQMVERAVETQFEKQQARLDQIFHDKLNSFGAALLKEQQQVLGEYTEGKTLYSSIRREEEDDTLAGKPTPALMLSQIMHSVQTVASETQIMRGELIMETKMYQQQLLEVVQNNLVYFLQQLEGFESPEEPQNPDNTFRTHQSEVSEASGGTFRRYPSQREESYHSLGSRCRFDDAISSLTSSEVLRARESKMSSALYSNPRTPPLVPHKEDKTVSDVDISMQDFNSANMSVDTTNDMSLSEVLASTSTTNPSTALTPYMFDDGPSEISEMEIFVRNITTRKAEGGSLRTVEEDRKFLTKVSRLFKPKKSNCQPER